ncbi:MAG: hypothetical protein VX278_03340 [Myxococcota bacterium]|nr:hypothetical protein [Myxococcota bacterium]
MESTSIHPIIFFMFGSICTLISTLIILGVGYLIYKKKNQSSAQPVGDIPRYSPEPKPPEKEPQTIPDTVEQPPSETDSTLSENREEESTPAITEPLELSEDGHVDTAIEDTENTEEEIDFDIEEALVPTPDTEEGTNTDIVNEKDSSTKERSAISTFQNELGIPRLDKDDIEPDSATPVQEVPPPVEAPPNLTPVFIPEDVGPNVQGEEDEVGEDDATVLMSRTPPKLKE